MQMLEKKQKKCIRFLSKKDKNTFQIMLKKWKPKIIIFYFKIFLKKYKNYQKNLKLNKNSNNKELKRF